MHCRDAALSTLSLFAVAALAGVIGDAGHELAAAFTPGVRLLQRSTVGLSSIGTPAWIALAGPLFNLCAALALALALARCSGLPPSWRYVAWVVGAFNLFNAVAYLAYSVLLGSGDWATVFAAVADAAAWRIPLGVAGVLGYWAAIRLSGATLVALCADGTLSTAQAARACRVSYLGFGTVLTLGALFNPVDWTLLLSSGMATGFLATAGILSLPLSLPAAAAAHGRLRLGLAWCVAGAVASLWFVAVMGPGMRLD